MTDLPTGVKTNGIGKRTTAHLNLTVSLADAPDEAVKRPLGREYQDDFRIGYAGREPRQ